MDHITPAAAEFEVFSKANADLLDMVLLAGDGDLIGFQGWVRL